MPTQHTIDMGASMETEEGLAIIDALNEVSDVLAMEGSRVTFVAEAPTRLGGRGRVREIEAYKCPRGLFLFFQEPEGPHWAVAGATDAEAIDAIHEADLREHVRTGLS
jgi:uncharacterized membrane protein YjjP (DUF1212 family)